MKASYSLIIGAILLAMSLGAFGKGLYTSSSIPDRVRYIDLNHGSDQVAGAEFHFTSESGEEKPDNDVEIMPNKGIPSVYSAKSVGFPGSYSCPILDIDVFELKQLADEGAGVTVAVLDTGIDANHIDLNGKIGREINLTDSVTAGDSYGHGTHIAGIIAAENSSGVMGLAPGVRLLNVKVADDRGKCGLSALENGIIWAVREGADVINVSIEMEDHSERLEKAINYAWEHGVLIIAAAGNNGDDAPIYPAYYGKTMAVTALGEKGRLAPLANYGDWVDIAAPGFDVYSTLPGDNYGYKTGTSFATAYVSGIAALLYNLVSDRNDNGLLSDEVRIALETGGWR
jgi:thermitase